MKQMNEMSARALTMEELENVNGGHPHTRLTWPGKNNLKRIDQIVNNIKKLFNAKQREMRSAEIGGTDLSPRSCHAGNPNSATAK